MNDLYRKMFIGEHAVEGDESRRFIAHSPYEQAMYVTHIGGDCLGCEFCDPDWEGPTKADVKAQTKAIARADRMASIGAYRVAHPELNPEASDATVWALIEIHAAGYKAQSA